MAGGESELNNNLNNIYSYYLSKELEINKLRAKDGGEYKKQRVDYLNEIINRVNTNASTIINSYCKPLIEHMRRAVHNSRFRYTLEFDAETKSRLLINTRSGLGITLFEIGVNIHPLLSIPYIPSSAIKGSLRSYIHNNHRDKEDIFGSEEQIGRLIVFDALPIEYKGRLLDGEVTTSMYGSGDSCKFKEHSVKPNPVIYPCIAKGVTFRFIMAFDSDELNKAISHYVFSMLSEGIGAKTLLGYGELSKKEAPSSTT